LIGEASCYAGLRATRRAGAVGRAATSGVVASMMLVIVSAGLLAFFFHLVGV
jgi:ABC-type transporter Mla maintaining outer membrane lipid asymmetry permease subunit MlaE